LIPKLQQDYFFHVWNEKPSLVGESFKNNEKEVRLMCSWDTNEEDIDGFVALIQKYLN
jgi:threonine aldolase